MPSQRTGDRPLGVVYTPPEVAAPMVRVALEPLLRGRTADELCALRICDFAVGEGAFVREVIAQLATAIRAVSRAGMVDGDARALAARCVAGVDIDARALAIARETTGCTSLRVGDALTLDWRATFPEIFARGGFDIVVGNPPYVRQEWRADKQALDGFASGGGVADLYVYFLELAHRILRPGGRYCVITPNKWLTVEYGRGLRGFLAQQGSVEGVVDLSRLPLFVEADAFPCITWGRVGKRASRVRGYRANEGDVETALRTEGVPVTTSTEPWHIDDPAAQKLIARLEEECEPLEVWLAQRDGALPPVRPARGVVTGCNRAFVIDRATRDRLLDADPASGHLIRPFVKGRDIRRWQTAAIDRHLLLIGRGTSLDEHPAIAKHLAGFRAALEPRPPDHRTGWSGRKPGTYRWFELQDPVSAIAASTAPRLFYQDIQTAPACALDRSGLVPDTTVWILPTEDLYVLAVLNSSLYGWYARHRFPPALNGAVRPKLAYIRTLPIARPSQRDRQRLERLVQNQLAGGSAELERSIDEVVLDIYQLAPPERRLLMRG